MARFWPCSLVCPRPQDDVLPLSEALEAAESGAGGAGGRGASASCEVQQRKLEKVACRCAQLGRFWGMRGSESNRIQGIRSKHCIYSSTLSHAFRTRTSCQKPGLRDMADKRKQILPAFGLPVECRLRCVSFVGAWMSEAVGVG